MKQRECEVQASNENDKENEPPTKKKPGKEQTESAWGKSIKRKAD